MDEIRIQIRKNIGYVLPECMLPELGDAKKGKVRDIYFRGYRVLMVTNDRVSAFDYTLPNLIPFKGQVLNLISEWAMMNTADICPNALVESIDPNIVLQRKMKNLNVECIVRGYLWGSMANAYEKGDRKFCGIPVPDGLIRFQKLDKLLFTPTTKADVGHDENMTMQEVEDMHGKVIAKKIETISLALYKRGCELMLKRGIILLDSKYEFGLDEAGNIHVIDEVNTPDSSRMIEKSEYDTKFPEIEKAMKSGKYKTVMELLTDHPELKMKEFSKQYVRDTLLELGFDPTTGKGKLDLSEDQVVECSARYIEVYERITGDKFQFPTHSISPHERIVQNLRNCGQIIGCCAIVMAGSDSDLSHMQKIRDELAKYKVPCQLRICSAHKQPARLEQLLKQYNHSNEQLCLIGCAGGTDALSGTASYHSVWPVVSCPPDGMNQTCLTNPPGSSNAFCCNPANVARFTAQVFSSVNNDIRNALLSNIKDKVAKLEKADSSLVDPGMFGA